MIPGQVLAERFEIERVAGAGGMGAVYRARDRLMGAPVAIKIVTEQGRGHAARFAHEARILAELGHPGVVRYVAHGETPEGQPWLAMEWLEGEDLAAHLARLAGRGLPTDEAVALGAAAADALGAAHARGVVHRDIKPSNIFLLDGDPRRPRLLDFGIARLGGATQPLTRTGAVIGTPGYLAPEQARGEQADPRADVFALGAVLFECLTGRPAFAGEHVMALLARLLLEEAPRARELCPDVPSALDELVARMLAKDPRARPADGAAVAAALRALDAAPQSAAAPAPSRAEALTAGEQRVLSVVVAAPDEALATLGGSDVTQGDTVPSGLQADRRRQIEAAVGPLGARVDVLGSGAALVTLEGQGGLGAHDQAARAARCALLLRPLFAGWGSRGHIAVVTGRAELTGRVPVGKLLDVAAALLSSPTLGGSAGTSPAVPPDPRPLPHVPALLDETTRALLDARFDVVRTEAGWELLGEREAADDQGGARRLLGRPSPCVGRDRELRSLLDLFEDCAAEPVARAALVIGPPGIGKSRLRDEVIQRILALRPDAEVWTGRGDALGAGAAFGVLGSALRSAAGLVGGEPLPERRKRLLERAARRVPAPDRRRVAELLGEIAGAPFPDDESPLLRAARQSPQTMAEQIRRAWEDFLAAELEDRPLVLAFEDLHWADAPSVRLVDQALGRHRERPLFVLALARPEVHDRFPRLWDDRDTQEIRLGALPRRAAERLVQHALGGAAPPAKIAEIVARAAGNAFYLEELIRAVAEGRGEALPDTVLAMVGARLGALDPEERRALRAASVLGQVFWDGAVSRLLGEDAAAALARLVEHEVVERRDKSRFPGEQELAFRHALLREGAYATLTDADRALGHKLAAAWLEQAGEEDAAVLAEHLLRGGEPARAAAHYLRAAERLLSAGDFEGAAAAAERGRTAGAEGEILAGLLLVQGEAHGWRGDPTAADRCIAEILGLTAPGTRAYCLAIAGRVANALILGQPESMLPLMTGQLLDVDPAPEAAGAFAWTLAIVAEVLSLLAQRPLADAHRARLDRLADALGAVDPLVWGWQRAARGHEARLVTRDPWAALHLHREAAEAFATAGERRYEDLMRVRMAADHVHLGAPAQAEAILRAVLAAGGDDTIPAKIGRLHLANALAEQGRIDEAVAEARALVASLSARGDRLIQGNARLLCALLAARRGDLADAEEAAQTGAALVQASPLDAAWADAVLAGVRLAEGRAEEAAALARGAAERCAALGATHVMQLDQQVILAEALAAAGNMDGARAAIAAARDDVLARAARIGDDEARERFLSRVSANARALALARAWLG